MTWCSRAVIRLARASGVPGIQRDGADTGSLDAVGDSATLRSWDGHAVSGAHAMRRDGLRYKSARERSFEANDCVVRCGRV